MGDPGEVFERLKAGDVIIFTDQSGQHIGRVQGRSPRGLLMVKRSTEHAARPIRPSQLVRQIAA